MFSSHKSDPIIKSFLPKILNIFHLTALFVHAYCVNPVNLSHRDQVRRLFHFPFFFLTIAERVLYVGRKGGAYYNQI